MTSRTWLLVAVLSITFSCAPVFAQDTQTPARSHAVLKGTLIGLAAGVAGGALFFAGTNCHYGSDSGAAMVACGAITGGIIAAGGIIGHRVGHGIEKRASKSASTVRTIVPWKAPDGLSLPIDGLDLRFPPPQAVGTGGIVC
jgi:hypothetical protein